MCGIAGIMVADGSSPVETATLQRMTGVLRHRGPDGYGFYLDDRVGLAHVRLSIVDLAGGAQPIRNEDGTIWITFNGEIFNYVELRRELEASGHRFYTKTDTEVIVHAYEQWGAGAWERFNGQFSFGLWDGKGRKLWLVRDHVGIVPLFFARADDRLFFGSEIKAILAGGFEGRLDPAGLARVFSLWAAPAPATVFAGLRSVEPGTAMCVDEQLQMTRQAYWRPHFGAAGKPPKTAEEAADGLGERLTRAIKVRLRADVPVGAYLSGGLDSSVIGQLTRAADSSPLQTFSLRFEDPAFDETAAQRTMASLLGTTHHEIVCGPREISEAIPEVVWHAETPLLRTGPAPMFLLSELVRKSGMKVVLTGEGADEFLAGYDVFKEDKVRRFWARQPESEARPALLARLHPYVARAQQTGAMWKEFFRNGLTDTAAPFYSHRLRWEGAAWSTRFLSPDVRRAGEMGAIEAGVQGLLPAEWKGWDPLSRAQAVEIVTFMSAYLLCSQGDRVAMGHSVETRYPFLDPEVMDYCSALPRGFRMCGLRDKVALRVLASRKLPAEVWKRRKWPYRAPIAGALFGPDAPDYVREMLSPAALGRSGLIDAAAAGSLAGRFVGRPGRMGEREEMALVGLLTLQILEQAMIRDLPGRAAEAERRLATVRPDVFEDRRIAAIRSGGSR